MCKEQWYPGVVELTGKLTNDSAWADVHPWEFSILSFVDPEGLFLRGISERAITAQQL